MKAGTKGKMPSQLQKRPRCDAGPLMQKNYPVTDSSLYYKSAEASIQSTLGKLKYASSFDVFWAFPASVFPLLSKSGAYLFKLPEDSLISYLSNNFLVVYIKIGCWKYRQPAWLGAIKPKIASTGYGVNSNRIGGNARMSDETSADDQGADDEQIHTWRTWKAERRKVDEDKLYPPYEQQQMLYRVIRLSGAGRDPDN